MTNMIDLLNQKLPALMSRKRWFDRKTKKIISSEIIDHVLIEINQKKIGLFFPALVFEDQECKFYYLMFKITDPANGAAPPENDPLIFTIGHNHSLLQFKEIDYCQDYNDLMNYLFRYGSIKTIKGNEIVLQMNRFIHFQTRAEQLQIQSSQPLQKNVSSNCVNLVEIDQQRYIHKIYKKLDHKNEEILVYQALQANSARQMEILAHYYYEDKQQKQYPLGLIQKYFAGKTFDWFLNQNIRSLWKQANNWEELSSGQILLLVNNHLKALLPALKQLGLELCRFHREINTIFHARREKTRFNQCGYLKQLKKQFLSLKAHIRQDDFLDCPLKETLLTLFERDLFVPFQSAFHWQDKINATFSHGDLHLSHILCRDNQGQYEVKIIDFDPKSIDLKAGQHAYQSILEDLLKLCRSIEYFVFDEINRALSQYLTLTEQAITRCRLGSGLALEQNQARLTGRQYHLIAAFNQLGEIWNQQVQAAIWSHYQADLAYDLFFDQPQNWTAPEKELNMTLLKKEFYLAMLFSQLEYNYNYQRDEYKLFDLYYLVQYIKKNQTIGADSSKVVPSISK